MNELDLNVDYLSVGDLVVWLAKMDDLKYEALDDNTKYLMYQARTALNMVSHLDVLDTLINNDNIDAHFDNQLGEIYGVEARDFFGQWMDWEQCYNALKMDWAYVSIGENDWWYRK